MNSGSVFRLFLMRHGKSDWNAGCSDFGRPLTGRGRSAARKIGSWLHAQGYFPEILASSPAERAWQTAGLVAAELGMEPGVIVREPGLYEADLQGLLDIIGKYSVRSGSVLLVGHNPGLDSVLYHLADEEPVLAESGKLMTTAAVAVLEFAARPFRPERHCARLLQLVRPREL